ncbi:MAG TPA: TetR/AcrR family transcriptional regulator [Vitreimonas sp.]|jgi:AcrR family transcriptional regulator|nr:TetR/AcrR family transcriptional regulator [Vitreimonas sp.]
MSRLANPELAERRRRQILDAALACFRRRGFHQTSMSEICTEADISAGALYRYFGSKSEIISAIAEDERSDSTVNFQAANISVLESLCDVARGFFQKIADGDGALVAEVMAEAWRDPVLAQNLAHIDSHYVAACAAMIGEGQQRGEVDPKLDPVQAARTLFAAIEGVALRGGVLGKISVADAEAQFRALAERYLAVRV